MADVIPPVVEQLLNFRVPPYANIFRRCPPVVHDMIRFFDTHLADNLILKHVEIIPDLVDQLANLAGSHITSSLKTVQSIPETRLYVPDSDYENPMIIPTAPALIKLQKADGVGAPCRQLASSCLLHPETPEEMTILVWDAIGLLKTDWDRSNPCAFIVQDHALRFSHKITSDRFPPATYTRLASLQRRYAAIALGVFLSPLASELMEDVDALKGIPFPWEVTVSAS